MGRDYDALLERCAAELERGRSRNVGLQLVCDLLQREVDHYDWFGLYILVPGERMLVLGPYQGASTDHVRIPFGRGICGQAAEKNATIVVDDVNKEGNYLACSLNVKSEIVVPVRREGRMIAQIDIDSHLPAAFGPADRAFLERLAEMVAPFIPDLSADA